METQKIVGGFRFGFTFTFGALLAWIVISLFAFVPLMLTGLLLPALAKAKQNAAVLRDVDELSQILAQLEPVTLDVALVAIREKYPDATDAQVEQAAPIMVEIASRKRDTGEGITLGETLFLKEILGDGEWPR